MTKRVLLCLVFLCCCVGVVQAQTGKLSGRVTDKATKEAIPGTNVVVKLNGAVKGYSTTDARGNYSVSPLTPGTYLVEFINMAFSPSKVSGVSVELDKTTFLNSELSDATIAVKGEADVIVYKKPIINPDETSTGGTISQEEIRKLPTREVSTMAAQVPGVYAADDNARVNVKGTRDNGTVYYINGVKVNSNVTPQLPTSSISQLTVISGGVPSQYGDAVGGIINITTSSPSAQYSGGIEAETSAPLDQYDNTLVNANLSGPIIKRRAAEGSTESPGSLLGFFISGQYQSSKDDNPYYNGVYQVKDDKLAAIHANPFTYDQNTGSLTRSAELLRFADLEKSKTRPNVASMRQSYNASLDFQPFNSVLFSMGGSFDRYRQNLYTNNYSMLNSDNNPQRFTTNWNAFARFTQNFQSTPNDSSSLLKNAYYQVQGDFSRYERIQQRRQYGDDMARYGYIGKFTQSLGDTIYIPRTPAQQVINPATGLPVTKLDEVGQVPSSLTFEPSGDNPLLANYTSQLLNNQDLYGLSINSANELLQNQGLLNGYTPNLIHSLYSGGGTVAGQYFIQMNDQYRVSALGAAEIGKHTFKLGFEFEQRIESFYDARPLNMWGAARGLVNSHIIPNDTLNPTGGPRFVTLSNGTVVAQQLYGNTVRTGTISTFATNLRTKLGQNPATNTDLVQIDSVDPNLIKVSDFSADEALNQSFQVVDSYQGYTYTGKRNTGKKVAFSDFFTDVQNRPQDAFRPTYAAAFLEDKFSIEDLIVRVGVRIDRYDANQKVLKDKYSLVDVLTVKDKNVSEFANGTSYTRPASLPDDAVIYVDKDAETTDDSRQLRITGYRSGDQYYTVEGNATDNLSQIQVNGSTFPYFLKSAQGSETPGPGLEYMKDRKLSLRAFTDYKPQINVMPRLSFSFPISEDALFFAHYDILTQRPEQNATLAQDYYFLKGKVFGDEGINNPNLKPQRKIDMQVGFEQRLTQSSGLTISAFYSELRDLIQYRPVFGAYPNDYVSFANIDFGTVKGTTLAYDLRRTKNVAFNASATLQFAKGTGSSATSGFNFASQGQPNLRVPIPLDYDQRLILKGSIDFRFADNEGPVAFGKRFLQNAGVNVLIQGGSGTPYSRQQNITQDVSIGVQQRSALRGQLNGSRLPATARVGLRVDKDFALKIGDKQLPVIKTLNVYFRVQNLFNQANVLRVFRYTGSPEDDGYLDDFRARNADNTAATYYSKLDLYEAKTLTGPTGNPTYALPRRMLIGATLTF